MAKNEVETVYKRKGRRIFDMLGNLVQEFPSISTAKTWSRKEQQAFGGLGMGRVRIIKEK